MTQRMVLVLGMAVLAMAGTACGDDDDDGNSDGTSGSGGRAGSSPSAGTGSSAGRGGITGGGGQTSGQSGSGSTLDGGLAGRGGAGRGGRGGGMMMCPAAEPMSGATCTPGRGDCEFGTRTCDCIGDTMTWSCWDPADCPETPPADESACTAVGMECEYGQGECECETEGWNCDADVGGAGTGGGMDAGM